MPTRSRIGSVSDEDLEKMRKITRIIRAGRVSRAEKGILTFQSGEQAELPENTLLVDCARNGSLFVKHGLKVFDGDRINIQFIMLPPPGMSTTVIAAMEIKYPDNEEYKNTVCQTIPVPQLPEDYFRAFRIHNIVNNAAIKEFGARYFLKRRCNVLHHISIFQTMKMIWKARTILPQMERKFDLWFKEEEKVE